MGYITKLSAVNQMLLASGENLVADLLGSSGIDTGIAEAILDQCALDFQLRGMAGNKVIRKLAAQQDTGYLVLPTVDSDEEGLLSADLVSYHVNTDGYRITVRVYNGRLWNIIDDTDEFESGTDYYVELITKLKWENLDTAVQRAIQASATRHYQILAQGDEAADGYLANQEAIFNIKGKSADMNDKKRNIFNSGDAYYRQRNTMMNDPSYFRYWRTTY